MNSKCIWLSLIMMLLLVTSVFAQQPAESPELFKNIFAFGPSYSQLGSNQFAGGFLEAVLISGGENPIYSFTLVDLSPVRFTDSNGKRTFAFQTVVTTGLAPFSRKIGPGRLWITGTIGGATAADNAGLAFSTGGAYSLKIKNAYILLFDARLIKTNLSPTVSSYQGTFGVRFGFGNY